MFATIYERYGNDFGPAWPVRLQADVLAQFVADQLPERRAWDIAVCGAGTDYDVFFCRLIVRYDLACTISEVADQLERACLCRVFGPDARVI